MYKHADSSILKMFFSLYFFIDKVLLYLAESLLSTHPSKSKFTVEPMVKYLNKLELVCSYISALNEVRIIEPKTIHYLNTQHYFCPYPDFSLEVSASFLPRGCVCVPSTCDTDVVGPNRPEHSVSVILREKWLLGLRRGLSHPIFLS